MLCGTRDFDFDLPAVIACVHIGYGQIRTRNHES